MGAIEIIILVFATAFVAAVIIVSAVNKAKRKKSGCRTCSGCPYASSCARRTNDGLSRLSARGKKDDRPNSIDNQK